MTTELKALAWTLVLTFVYVAAAITMRNRETGMGYNVSNRNTEAPPMGPVTQRLYRAQANLYESLPVYAAAVLIAQAAGVHSALTVWGAWLFPLARAVYLPVYAIGVPYLRTAVWGVGLAGVVMLLTAVLRAG